MPVIGLDLGSNNFRATELEKKKGVYSLNKFGDYENPKINLQSDNQTDQDLYSSALKDFVSEVGFTTPEVNASLNEMYVYMRNITLPKMNDSDLKDSIAYEAEQYIPLPLTEVTLSYQRLDYGVDNPEKMQVQLVAAKKTVLEKYVNILKKAKLLPISIEPETIALGRILGDSRENPMGTLILDLGFKRSLVVVVYYGYVSFTRNIPVGGEIITRAIQQGLGLDYVQAEEYKKVYGIDPNQVEGKIFVQVKPIIDNLITEIRRATLFFTKQTPGVNIKRVILTGGTAQMPGLLSYMAANLDLEVELANPMRNIQFSPKLENAKETLSNKGSIYSTAIGLALKE